MADGRSGFLRPFTATEGVEASPRGRGPSGRERILRVTAIQVAAGPADFGRMGLPHTAAEGPARVRNPSWVGGNDLVGARDDPHRT
jgi:hypothetical protein